MQPHWEPHNCFRHFFATDRRSERKHKRYVECRVNIVDHERCVEPIYGVSRSLSLRTNLNLGLAGLAGQAGLAGLAGLAGRVGLAGLDGLDGRAGLACMPSLAGLAGLTATSNEMHSV